IAVRRKFLRCAKAESRIYSRNERISNARRRSRDSAVRTIADVLDNHGIRISAARITRIGEELIAGDLGIEIAEGQIRSEAHTSETQSLMRIPYAVFCLKK